VTVELDGLAAGSRPLRIALLADLHVAKLGDTPARLRETVAKVVTFRPDLILIAGDFRAAPSVRRYGWRMIVEPLKGLKAPLGVFAVLGNHDYEMPRRSRAWLKSAGVRMLDNEAARAGPLTIVGIGDDYTKHARVAVAEAAAKRLQGVPIALTHDPDILSKLSPNVQLALAGHTHCGQVVLPIVGPLDRRSRAARRYLCGVVHEGERTTVITSGLGVSRLPFRLGAPPDFWVITVLPSAKARSTLREFDDGVRGAKRVF
jgi:predicted MPP superfamily phosphohydrolase